MKLDDLSADELARIDSVCLEFERRLGSGPPLSVDEAVQLYLADTPVDEPCSDRVTLLREELVAIEREIHARQEAETRIPESSLPFRSKTVAAPMSAGGSSAGGSSGGGFGSSRNGRSPSAETETQWQSPGSLKLSSDTDTDEDKPGPRGEASIGEAKNPVYRSERADAVPSSIGPYSIRSVLGRGGMGVVYRAVDTRLDRPVAIKMLGFPDLPATDPKRLELVDRFEREAKAVAALSHPNIVELFDVGVSGDAPFAVMEFLAGVTLANQLTVGPMPIDQACQIGIQIASALATAHAAGVVHRDLKPQNVMLIDQSGSGEELVPRVKLVDFGLSRLSDSPLPFSDDDSNPTRSGIILGTPGYMAPEQARGEPITSAADMFGLGCVLYEVVYGKPAIPGQTPADRLAETLTGEVEYDHKPCERSKVVCKLIADCLQKDPFKRPTATEVYSRLRKFERNPGSVVDRLDDVHLVAEGRRFLRRNALAGIVGGFAGALFGGISLSRSKAEFHSIRSLAVLTLRDAAEGSEKRLPPLENRMITDGETLASAIVNELSLIDGLIVLPYARQKAETREEFQELGRELDVEAFLTGTYEYQTFGNQRFWVLSWQLVSADNGRILIGEQFITEQRGDDSGGQFLAQSEVASNVAKRIGTALVTSGQGLNPPNPMSYGCMMKGRAYSFADSTKALLMSLKCYDHAHTEDPRRSEPLAAIAVTSLELAGRTAPEESQAYLARARETMTQALGLDSQSRDARLAEAMLEWQSLHHYQEAYDLLEQLASEQKFNWKIQHQRGLLLAALGMESEALDALQTATKSNPMSMVVKIDRCRVDWFFGNETRAMKDAKRYRDSLSNDDSSRALASGLLIDIFEQNGDWQSAAMEWSTAEPPEDEAEYYRLRREGLSATPYGLFGPLLNETILDARVAPHNDEQILGILNDSGATMFPLLLARHPAFAALRKMTEAGRYLPPSTTKPLMV